MTTADYAVCFNIMRERGLVQCRNPSCGTVIGSYVDGPKVMVHLFNIRELLFEPQLQYARTASLPVLKDFVVLLKFGEEGCKLDDADVIKARNYVLDPTVLRSRNLTGRPVVLRSASLPPLKRVYPGTYNVVSNREPMVKIPKSVMLSLPGYTGAVMTSVSAGSERSPMPTNVYTSTVTYSTPMSLPSTSLTGLSTPTQVTMSRPPISSTVISKTLTSSSAMYLPPALQSAISPPSTSSRAVSMPLASTNTMSLPPAVPGNDANFGASNAEFEQSVSTEVNMTEDFDKYCQDIGILPNNPMDEGDLPVIEEDYFKLFGL